MKKRWIAAVMAALLISVPAGAGEMLTGGWAATEDPALTQEAKEALQKAVEGLEEEYTPVALLGTQVVAGTNYCILCQEMKEGVPEYAYIYVYRDLQGNAQIIDSQRVVMGVGPEEEEEASVDELLGAAVAEMASSFEELNGTMDKEGISKYGNAALSISCEELLGAGYQYGDVVTVSFLDTELDLLFCSNYSDVDSGETAVLARTEDQYVSLAINMGDFASTYGIAQKNQAEDGTVTWDYLGEEEPVPVKISMKEPGGYYAAYMIHQLEYTDERSDYPDLTDEEFANFRNIATTGMGEGILYRTASPVNPVHNRNTYADEALKNAGVTVIMNLADDEETMKAYEGFADSYYAGTEYICLSLGVDFEDPVIQERLAKGLRFFAEHPGVYAVHCTEGKDRAGFVSALLECFMGASLEEVLEDYMVTFYNYYGVMPEEERYQVIWEGNLYKNLCRLFEMEDLHEADLEECAAGFMKKIGLSDEELGQLRQNLSGTVKE